MSQFDKKSFEHLKNLCRIDCTEEEETDIICSFSRILEYVAHCSEVDTEGVAPSYTVLGAMAKSPLRTDSVHDVMPRAQFLANAPDQVAGMIRVPPVLKDL